MQVTRTSDKKVQSCTNILPFFGSKSSCLFKFRMYVCMCKLYQEKTRVLLRFCCYLHTYIGTSKTYQNAFNCIHCVERLLAGLPDFSWLHIPKRRGGMHQIVTKLLNGQNKYRIAIKCTKWPKNMPTFSILRTLQNLSMLGFLVWKYTIWQPWLLDIEVAKICLQSMIWANSDTVCPSKYVHMCIQRQRIRINLHTRTYIGM
jgi:hypothetical protein